MSRLKCPGSTPGDIKAENLKCPSCGCETEIFSDETWLRCPSCGARAERSAEESKVMSCYDWCRHARECMGTAAYEKYAAGRRNKNESKKKNHSD